MRVGDKIGGLYKKRLPVREVIHFCEEHECGECPANILLDCRTELERQHFHYPCYINLVDENERNNTLNVKDYQ